MSERNLERASFLKSRRQRLTVEAAGLPPSTHRRGSTVRREDVAWLADVGITWYTWLEQGRPMKMAAGTLDRIGAALQLDSSECEYLRRLMHPAHAEHPYHATPVSQAVRALVNSYVPGCAFVIGPRWDVLFWNTGFATFFEMGAFRDGAVVGFERNGLWLMFMADRSRALFRDWDASARSMVATFRFEQADYGGDPYFAELIDALSSASAEFATMWAEAEVLSLASWGARELRGRASGANVAYRTVTLRIPDAPDQTLVFCVPLQPNAV